MQPKNDDDSRNVNVPALGQSSSLSAPERAAAAQLMRQQINSIYDNDQNKNPYKQTHSEKTDHDSAGTAQTSDWNQYHTAWQSYYQQYYERYYISQLNKRQNAIAPKTPSTVPAPGFAQTPISEAEVVTKDQAVDELRLKILTEVKGRSQKVRKSRHFMPILAALTVALVFSILQYNRLLVAQVKAYVSPGSISPQNIVLDPTTNLKVGPEPKLIIPKINVDAPVVYDVPSLEENLIQSKLQNGVVHYPIPGANSMPGQAGNTVILGHSSNDVFDNGNYKFVFVQLDKLVKGDTFYLNYQGTRYTYSVTEKKVIDPTEVGQLVINTDKPLATLVTCTPPGTALKRLVVIAEQISPDPTKATAKAESASNVIPGNISGNSPTLFERLFQ
ncbi:MAG: sortase [Candidatus Saccharimonadales bacterium]